MKRRKTLLILIFIIMALTMVMVLSSCDLFGKKTTIVPPTIKNVSMLKTDYNYQDSKEYKYNKDTENAMAIESGGEFLISIEYDNPKKYSISYLKLNGEKIMPSQFEEGSNKQQTIIKLQVAQSTTATEESYIINSIFYNTGSEVKKLKFNEEFDMEFNIKVNPTFSMTLNYQNADKRSSINKPEDVTRGISVKFGEQMSSVGVFSADYSLSVGVPIKEGGWIFEGWYTKEHGRGELVTGSDPYFFWSNINLYAHYTRIFEYEIVELDAPLDGYSKGVIITKDNTRGAYPKMEIYNTILDEKLVLDSDDNVVGVSAVEYPVIKVGNNAFSDIKNILELKIGKYVEEIGYKAFNNCNQLKKVTFENNSRLKYIGDFAFQSTKSMGITDAFTLPESVEYLGNFAFRYSGWSNTTNSGVNESILHIYPRLKFIGFKCFMDTGFRQIIFEPGCNFESQITDSEGSEIEKVADGWKTIRPLENRIGANIFAGCVNIIRVEIKSEKVGGVDMQNGLNIIPDKAFDADRYPVKGVEAVVFAEGLEYIGMQAFYYQRKILELNMPNTLKVVGTEAFYMCESVITLKFEVGSQLEELHKACFGNLANIDRVVITSEVFRRYGNGPFANCDRLKSIEFPNIWDKERIPIGFHINEREDQVVTGVAGGGAHRYADLLFGTFNIGVDEGDSNAEKSSYSLPTRIFCNGDVITEFQDYLRRGKATYLTLTDAKDTTQKDLSPGGFNNVIFVNNIELVLNYANPTRKETEPEETKIALQEIFNMSGGKIGYSVVYWSDRSKIITIPSIADLLPSSSLPILEMGMYALPTSVEELYLPASITTLEHDAFNGCVNLNLVRFANLDALKYIGDYAFFGTKITEFTAGTGLKVIGQNAFMRCRSLQWVDLSQASIINPPVEGRLKYVDSYKYEYEKYDKDGKDRQDYSDTLYDGAFQGCVALSWVALPPSLKQMNNGLFSGCTALRTVILYSTSVYSSTSNVSDETFYANALPSAVYDSAALQRITIYVAKGTRRIHEIILPMDRINTYITMDDGVTVPSHP